jgi:hypothetical protein
MPELAKRLISWDFGSFETSELMVGRPLVVDDYGHLAEG